MRESFDKTLSPGTPQGEQEEYDDELDLTETPSREQEYHAFSDPSTEESREKIEVPPLGLPVAGGAEPSSDSVVDLDISLENYSDDFSEEEEVSVARYRQSHRSKQPAPETSRETS